MPELAAAMAEIVLYCLAGSRIYSTLRPIEVRPADWRLLTLNIVLSRQRTDGLVDRGLRLVR